MRHERVTIRAIAAGIVLTLPLPAAPQQTGKLVRIGCLSAASEAAAGHFFDAFRQRLRELRYVEGRDVVLEYRWANGRAHRRARRYRRHVHESPTPAARRTRCDPSCA